MGVLVWGEGSTLRLTIGRADFWDHRGGGKWRDEQTYANIRAAFDAQDPDRMGMLFPPSLGGDGVPGRPSIMPVGRLELDLGSDAAIRSGELDLQAGKITILVKCRDDELRLQLVLDMSRPLLAVDLPDGLEATVRAVPAWEFVRDHCRRVSIPEPQRFTNSSASGWVQELPADPSLCVAYRMTDGALTIVTTRDDEAEAARDAAIAALDMAAEKGFKEIYASTGRWWQSYWKEVPRIRIPNDRLQFLHDYGMYRFGAMTCPLGVAAGLQGPWIEDRKMPPWSADYHFNINVQMCYWPAYRGNRLEHLKPLWELIGSWTDTLRENARKFVGIDDGLVLAHAVDDRCTPMGGFWTGHIDHGCTAWVAHMMFRYYKYTADQDFLRETAWPFMRGAMRVYEEMMEKRGETYTLPLSVSPEYKGASIDAGGADASFQLAAIHRLVENLLEAAHVLAEPPDPVWADIRAGLPRACLGAADDPNSAVVGPPTEGMRILLWRGQDLAESHRHHSHLGGLYPFDVIALDDPLWRPVIENSFRHWVSRGMGMWSGWCVPWAAILNSRLDNPDMAELLLEIWERVFAGQGHGTFHDCVFPGFTLMGAPALWTGWGNEEARANRERMQMDAAMSCTAAIHEMLLQTRRGVNVLFAGAPDRWREVAFDGMRTEGAFLVSASRHDGSVGDVRVRSEAGGVFRLRNPWRGPMCVCRASGEQQPVNDEVLEIAMGRGEEVVLKDGTAGSLA